MVRKDVEIRRSYKVTKANVLIQRSRTSLPVQQQKMLGFILTKIQPEDTEFTEYIFDIKEFCEVCNIEASGMYSNLKEAIKNMADRSYWAIIDDQGTETLLRWIQKPYVSRRSGKIKIRLDEDMRPYLLELKRQFTTYSLIYILGMKSQYSIRIYELLKSYEKLGRWEFDIGDLKRKLMCENYTRYPDFKRKVLDIAKKEINDCSDLKINCYPIKEGRRYAKIAFTIELKQGVEQSLATMKNIEVAMKKKPRQKADKDSLLPDYIPPLDGQETLFKGGDNK